MHACAASRRARTARAPPSPSATPSAVGVGRRDEHRVAPGAGERVDARRSTIELNCLPRRVLSTNAPRRALGTATGATAVKCARPSGVGEPAAVAEARAAPLDRVAGRARASRCPRTRARRGRSRRGSRRRPAKRTRSARSGRTRAARSPKISHSLRASPTRGPGDLGAEHDAALGGGLRAAARLLVARRRGQQHDRRRPGRPASGAVTTMSWWTRSGTRAERGLDVVGVGQHLEEVAAARVEDVELAARRGLDHLRGGRGPGRRGPGSRTARRARPRARRSTASPPGSAVAYAPISAPPCTPEWPRIGMRPAPGRPTLPRARPRLTIAVHVVGAVRVLRDAHRPDEHGARAPRRRCCAKRSMSARGGAATARSRSVERPRARARRRSSSNPSVWSRTNSSSIAVELEQHLQHAVEERDVAAGVHRRRTRRRSSCRTARSRRCTAPSSARGPARAAGSRPRPSRRACARRYRYFMNTGWCWRRWRRRAR